MPVCLRAALIGIIASVLLAPTVFTQSPTPKAAPVVGTTPTPPAPPTGAPAHRYTIEVSNDGKTFATVLDKRQDTVTQYVEFDELPPTACRSVRLTLTDWPRNAAAPLGMVESTVVGKAVTPVDMKARGDAKSRTGPDKD